MQASAEFQASAAPKGLPPADPIDKGAPQTSTVPGDDKSEGNAPDKQPSRLGSSPPPSPHLGNLIRVENAILPCQHINSLFKGEYSLQSHLPQNLLFGECGLTHPCHLHSTQSPLTPAYTLNTPLSYDPLVAAPDGD